MSGRGPMYFAALTGLSVALAACGQGDDAVTSGQPSTQSNAIATPASGGDTTSHSERTPRRESGNADRRPDEKRNRERTNASGEDDRERQSARRSPRSRDPQPGAPSEPGPGCPPALSAKQCEALARTLGAGGEVHRGNRTPCPQEITRSECRSLAEGIENQPANAGESGGRSCPPGISRDLCDRLARELGG